MNVQKFFIIIAGLVAAGVLGWTLYANVRIFTPRPEPAQEIPKPAAAHPESDASSVAGSMEPIAKLPEYTGLPVGSINEDVQLVKSYSESSKTKMREELATLAASVAKRPNQLDSWLRIGVIKNFFGDYAGARDAWEYASALRPGNVVSFMNLGGLYAMYLKNNILAEKNYRQAIHNSPADPSGYIELASLYRYSYKEKESDIGALMEEGIGKSEDDLNFYIYLGGYWAEKGDNAKAITHYEKALALDPQNKPIAAEITRLKSSAN